MYAPPDDRTLEQLAAFKRYLSAFTAASKDEGYTTAYIDAFAGAEYCVEDRDDPAVLAGFPHLADASSKALLRNSARVALTAEPAFDGYMFIERSRRRGHLLEALQHEYAHRNVQIRRTEVNRELRRVSHLDWQTRRAVLFVDAYAARLEWDAIMSIAETRAIDTWLLIPVGVAAGRQAVTVLTFPPHLRARLNALCQVDGWFESICTEPATFEAMVDTLGRSLTQRLGAAFSAVAPPRVMRNRTGAPQYVVCFASSAVGRGGTRAVELANAFLASATAAGS